MTRPLRIGLTGGIGSGKSTVAALLAAHGAAVVDVDAISRALTAPGGDALPGLRNEFGDAVFDTHGALDRNRLRELAFCDGSAKRRLEALLHPLIRAETARRVEACVAPVLVLDIPLLVESGRWRDQVDRVLVVDCDSHTQIERVMRRSGWTADTVGAVVAAQASREARRACADAVIHNQDITPEQLAAQVAALWKTWVIAPG